MLKKLVHIFCLLILVSCSNNEIIENTEENQEVEKSIVLLDTLTTELKKDTSTSLKDAEFHPLYIGKRADSIQIIYDPNKVENVTHEWDLYKKPDSLDLTITIDTSRLIASVQKYIDWKMADSLGEISPIFYSLQYQSYPVIIENKTSDTLEIGYGEYIPLIIEAKDQNGEWKPIQKPFVYFCGTGMPFYFLPPEEILITSCKIFDGDFKTTLRLVYGWEKQNYSNEFSGFIDEGQFEYRTTSDY